MKPNYYCQVFKLNKDPIWRKYAGRAKCVAYLCFMEPNYYRLVFKMNKETKVQVPQKYSGTASELFNRIVADAGCDARKV